VPAGFVFAVKASRYITHLKRFREPVGPLRRLLDRTAGLGERLGPILFQLPAGFEADLEWLDGFLPALAAYLGQRFAFEFRHPSWLSAAVYSRLEAASCALCLPVGMGLPCDPRLTADWTYVRMHRGARSLGFGDAELEEWARTIGPLMGRAADAYVYFNNDTGGHALRDAPDWLHASVQVTSRDRGRRHRPVADRRFWPARWPRAGARDSGLRSRAGSPCAE